eukprot:506664-Pelagomonas_calceolata.AAC.1
MLPDLTHTWTACVFASRDNGVTTFVEPAAYPNVEPDLTQSTCSRPLQQNGEPAGPGAVAAAATESIVSAWEAAIS